MAKENRTGEHPAFTRTADAWLRRLGTNCLALDATMSSAGAVAAMAVFLHNYREVIAAMRKLLRGPGLSRVRLDVAVQNAAAPISMTSKTFSTRKLAVIAHQRNQRQPIALE